MRYMRQQPPRSGARPGREAREAACRSQTAGQKRAHPRHGSGTGPPGSRRPAPRPRPGRARLQHGRARGGRSGRPPARRHRSRARPWMPPGWRMLGATLRGLGRTWAVPFPPGSPRAGGYPPPRVFPDSSITWEGGRKGGCHLVASSLFVVSLANSVRACLRTCFTIIVSCFVFQLIAFLLLPSPT